MYCLVSEKPLRLVYGPPAADYLAIGDTFYETAKLDGVVKVLSTAL